MATMKQFLSIPLLILVFGPAFSQLANGQVLEARAWIEGMS